MSRLHRSPTDAVLPAPVPPKEPPTLGIEAGAMRLRIEELEPRLVPVLLVNAIDLGSPVRTA
jgi:hypothetical protein